MRALFLLLILCLGLCLPACSSDNPLVVVAVMSAADGKTGLAGNLYIIDVPDFRTDDKEGLLGQIRALMNNRFDVAEYLMGKEPWDFFMMVEMGVDRLHHAFWRHADSSHPHHDPDMLRDLPWHSRWPPLSH